MDFDGDGSNSCERVYIALTWAWGDVIPQGDAAMRWKFVSDRQTHFIITMLMWKRHMQNTSTTKTTPSKQPENVKEHGRGRKYEELYLNYFNYGYFILNFTNKLCKTQIKLPLYKLILFPLIVVYKFKDWVLVDIFRGWFNCMSRFIQIASCWLYTKNPAIWLLAKSIDLSIGNS